MRVLPAGPESSAYTATKRTGRSDVNSPVPELQGAYEGFVLRPSHKRFGHDTDETAFRNRRPNVAITLSDPSAEDSTGRECIGSDKQWTRNETTTIHRELREDPEQNRILLLPSASIGTLRMVKTYDLKLRFDADHQSTPQRCDKLRQEPLQEVISALLLYEEELAWYMTNTSVAYVSESNSQDQCAQEYHNAKGNKGMMMLQHPHGTHVASGMSTED
ncbi:hypothetical protein V1527DRAFT_484876 [Lipomyces starkeyi]